MTTEARPRRTTSRGDETRRRILDHTVARTAEIGLFGLSVGLLADELGMSKAGLIGHFGSMEALQVAVLDHAHAMFLAAVVEPVLAGPARGRALALADAWLTYAERWGDYGGCLFSQAAHELDGRPGPARDRLVALQIEWLGRLEAALREGQASGELTKCDVVELARELHGHLLAANWARQLLGERDAFSRARRLVTRRLRELTPTRGKKV